MLRQAPHKLRLSIIHVVPLRCQQDESLGLEGAFHERLGMVVSLLSLKKSEKKWLEEIALDKKCSPSFIEKDYYFCQLLKILSRLKSDDFSLVFTGGTALSKAYNLIDRFSEDCDMLLIGKNLTRSTLSKIRDHIANHINAESNDVLKIYEKNAKNNNQNMTFSIAYPKFFDTPVAVRPELKLEVIAKEETLLDTKNERIISFLRFAQKKIDDHTTFKCLAIEEILAGKISALRGGVKEGLFWGQVEFLPLSHWKFCDYIFIIFLGISD